MDDDVVDASNLQRQVLHSTGGLGEPKVESAEERIRGLNPDVEPVGYQERLSPETIDRILGDGWDVVVDGADNFPTRYLLNDASVWHGVPVVHGSIFRFEGQVTVFAPGRAYRCLPQPPPPELAPSCAEGGVLGVLPGVIGSLQGTEALKLVLGIGEPLIGRLLLFDALEPLSPRSPSAATPRALFAATSRRSRSTSTTSSLRRRSLRVPPEIRAELLEHARTEAPNEACGVVVLRDGEAVRYERAGTRSLPHTGFAWRSRRRSGSWRTTGTSSPSFTRTGPRAATLSCRRPARGALAGPALPDPAGHRETGRVADQGRFGGRGCRRVAPSSSAPVSSAPRSPTGWQAAAGT